MLIADDDACLGHSAPPGHPERAERLLALREGLELARPGVAGSAYVSLAARDADFDELARVHGAAYLEQLGQLAGATGMLDEDTFYSQGSVAAALRGAGSAIELALALLRGQSRFGFALPRPPGHHARRDSAMGFCLLNNVAAAAAAARAAGAARVLILDWDVHHGNGTQEMFYADPSVLFISLHQTPAYPGTGEAAEQGAGEGRGRTVNLPLPRGATDAVYAAAFERVVLPIAEQFAPDLTLVSAGFDAHVRDPLAQMSLTSEAYGFMAEALARRLGPRCPLGLVLEGGYDLEALTGSIRAVVEGLRAAEGKPAGPAATAREISSSHGAALARIEGLQRPYWRLG